jgi:hypothetical protein
MLTAKTILSKKPFPSFIKNHNVFKTIKQVKKIFPEIGLVNCEEVVNIDNKNNVLTAARQLIECMRQQLDYGRFNPNHQYTNLISQLVREFNNECIVCNDGGISLALQNSVKDSTGKVVFKEGERLFRVYNKLRDMLFKFHGYHQLAILEQMQPFKTFSSINVPSSQKYKICFSSDNIDGLWDIATMSMRGIVSCQKWGKPQSKQVIGSIVDPFTGIIYLTSGTNTKYGSKMIRRCVVKFVVDRKAKKPYIGLERMYPDYDDAIGKQFIKFIREKTKNKFEVVDMYNDNPGNDSYIPMSKVIDGLSGAYRPYTDCRVYHGQERFFTCKQEETLNQKIEKTILSAFRSIKLAGLPKEDDKWVRAFKAKVRTDERSGLYIHINSQVEMANDDSEGSTSKMIKFLVPSFNEARINNAMFYCINDNRDTYATKRGNKTLTKVSKIAAEKLHIFFEKELDKLQPKFPKRLPKNAPIYLKYV